MAWRNEIMGGLATGVSPLFPRTATARTGPVGRPSDVSIPRTTLTARVPGQLVPAGVWTVPRLDTRSTGNEGSESRREIQVEPEYRSRIDGEQVVIPGQFWGDIHKGKDERVEPSWNDILPYPEGDHRFVREVDFPTSIQYTDDYGREHLLGGTETVDCTERVPDLDVGEPALGNDDFRRAFGGLPDE